MSFTLPDLPYAHDALAPYMSRETLEYHHDKHHLAYVNNGNNLLKGTYVANGANTAARQDCPSEIPPALPYRKFNRDRVKSRPP